MIAAVEQQVSALRRFKLGVGTVPSDQLIGRAPDINKKFGTRHAGKFNEPQSA